MDEIVTEIEIDASPAVVWGVLTDFDRYSEWNPSMTIEGEPNEAARPTITFTYPNQKPTTITSRVSVAKAPVEFRWQGRFLIPGLYDAEHRFVLDSLDGGSRTLLRQAESFRGILVWLINRRLGSDIKAGFEQMNESLKRRVETGDTSPRWKGSRA